MKQEARNPSINPAQNLAQLSVCVNDEHQLHNSLRDYALRLGKALNVTPFPTREKQPLIKDNWRKGAVGFDEELFKQWWQGKDDASQFAIPIGAWFAVDLDLVLVDDDNGKKKHSRAEVYSVERKSWASKLYMLAVEELGLPKDAHIIVTGGGLQFHVRVASEEDFKSWLVWAREKVKSLKVNGFGIHIDYKASFKGYTLAPPSIHHISGEKYVWSKTRGAPSSVEDLVLWQPPTPKGGNGSNSGSGVKQEQVAPPISISKFYDASANEIDTVVNIIKPHWQEGQRQWLALWLCGFLAKLGWSQQSAEKVIHLLVKATQDCELDKRIKALEFTYKKLWQDPRIVAGFSKLKEMLPVDTFSALVDTVSNWQVRQVIEDKPTDYLMAQTFARLVEKQVCWVREWGWLMWRGKRWERVNDNEVVDCAQKVLSEYYIQLASAVTSAERRKTWLKFAYRAQSYHAATQVIKSAISMLRAEKDEFDTNPYLLNCENGVVDLRTGTIHPHDPSYKLTKLCPVEYHSNAVAPTWECFLNDVFLGDKQLIEFVQKALGYSITGDTKEQVFFICWGSGSNGKSTLLSTIHRILGDYAKSVARDALLKRDKRGDNHPTAIADLVGCRFALLQETEEGKYLDASLVKALTGGDKIKARFMHRDYFEFFPEFKPWLCTNYKPIITDTTYALWRRLILIPFRAVFDEKKRDPEMPQKLWQEKEGILAWLIRGCLRWQKEGLNPPPVVREATKAYQTEMDIIQQWIEDCCVSDPHAVTPLADLYSSYQEWCKERDEEPISKRKFANRLTEKGYDSLDLWDSVLRKSVKVRRGIRLKQESGDGNDGGGEGRGSNPTNSSQDASHSSLCEVNFPIFSLNTHDIEENTASKVSTAMSESLGEEGEPPPATPSALPEGEKYHNYLSQHDNANHSEKVEDEEEFFLI